MNIEKATSAFIGLLVSAGGLGIVYFWRSGRPFATVLIVAAFAILGWLFGFLGEEQLPSRPGAAMVFLEFWILLPCAIASPVVAAIIWAGIMLAPRVGDSDAQKELLKAAFATVAGFLTAVALKSFEDADANFLASHIKKVFQKHYKRCPDTSPMEPAAIVIYFAEDSRGELQVQSDAKGWGFKARHERARAIAEEIARRSSACPP
jgi:hypothetical protein